MKVDYIIIGQGIAGSVMALSLHQRGRSVLIVNKGGLSSSSAVAAGVYNPFNFRRTIPTRWAEIAAPAAKEFYTSAEQLTGETFHASKKIIRVFADDAEKQRWAQYVAGGHSQFAHATSPATEILSKLNAPFGTGIVEGGGVVNTGAFLHATKKFFSERNEYREEQFSWNLEFSNENVIYNGEITARKIIFCEGHLAAENKYYPRLSIAPTKGETLHVSIPGLNLTEVVNGPVYLSPLGNDLYACGATFNPGKSDEETTEAGRDELLRKLESMMRLSFRAESQFAGVRPAGRDRKPVIGISQVEQNVAIFNGFGSKGVLLAPYLAQVLVNHMENGAEIPAELSLARFKEVK